MLRLLLCCMSLLWSASLWADAQSEYIEIKESGHFISEEQTTDLLLRYAKNDTGSEWVGIYYRSDHDLQLVVPAEEMNRYQMAAPVKMCKDPDTGLDQLLFTLSMGGTANGDLIDALFVYYDPELKQFRFENMNGQFVDAGCSLKTSLKHARQVEEHAAMVEALQPPEAGKTHLKIKPLPDFSLQAMRAMKQKIDRMEDYPVWEAGEHVRQPSELHVEVLAENRRWRIVQVYYEGPGNTSRGVLLKQDRQDLAWSAFYAIPGGSSKVPLYLPDATELHGDELLLRLCTDCSWWGEYAPFRINLNTLAYEQLPDAVLPASMP